MRYMVWSINLTAYSDGTWGVGVVRREYDRGQLKAAELESLQQATAGTLRWSVKQATDLAIDKAQRHLEATYGSGPADEVTDPLF